VECVPSLILYINLVNQNILITGGSGMIGTRLTQLLTQRGYSVSHLGRTARHDGVKTYLWDIHKRTIDRSALATADAVVHLAGANVGEKRWTKKRKRDILQSRLESTELLYQELRKGKHNVMTLVSASAVGYYGSGRDQYYFTEKDKQGQGFQADVVAKWERAVDKIATLGIRVVKLRGGVVLSEKGGALKEMMLPVKLYVGSPLGTGDQMMSWIHIDDLCRMYIKAIEDESMEGVYNAVAPNPVSNKEFTKIIARTLKKPIWLPRVPGFVIEILFGEMAEVVLQGSMISSEKIESARFDFKFVNVQDALQDLLKK
jgi:hypothetical protein